jgi:multidrug efflux pump subunit AcrA (membrane-fusion protein)
MLVGFMPKERLILVFAIFIFVFSSCKNIHNASRKTVNRAVRDSLVVMDENGILGSINAQIVKAPSHWNVEYRIIYLMPEGHFAHIGDTLVKFDPAPVQEQLDEARAQLALARQKLIQIQEENAMNLRNQLATIRAMRMQFRMDSARLADAIYESEAIQQDLKLQLKKSALDLKKAEKKLETQKIINNSKYHLQLVEIEHALGKVKSISRMLEEMSLIATQTGIAVYGNRRGTQIREGETVYPGQRVMQVADLGKMKAVLMINEVDRETITSGQKVRLIVNAYPDTVFTGTVHAISKIADLIKEDGTVKAYETDVYLDAGQNYRLKPGLSVRATIITDTLHNVFKIPEWCLKRQNGRWLVVSEQGEKIPVDPVRLNNGFVYVKGNLKDNMVLQN